MHDSNRAKPSIRRRLRAPLLALLGLALGTAWSAAAHARAFQVACNVVSLN